MEQSLTSNAEPAGGLENFTATIGEQFVDNAKISTRDVDVFYGEKQAIFNASLDIGCNEVVALIGLPVVVNRLFCER